MPGEQRRQLDHEDEAEIRTRGELAHPGRGAWKSPRDEVALEQQAASSEAIEDSPVDLDPDRHLSEDEGRRPPEGMAELPGEEAAREEPHAGYDAESQRDFGQERSDEDLGEAAEGSGVNERDTEAGRPLRENERAHDQKLGRGLS